MNIDEQKLEQAKNLVDLYEYYLASLGTQQVDDKDRTFIAFIGWLGAQVHVEAPIDEV